MSSLLKTYTFSDLNRNYPVNDVLNKDILAINGSLENILTTTPGERLFLPTFGSRLKSILFEPLSEKNALRLLHEAFSSINIWEPRVRLDYKKSNAVPLYDDNMYDMTLYYSILKFNLSGVFNKSFYSESI